MENAQERLLRYLQDAHAAETGIAQMLEGFVNEADVNDSVRFLFQEHLAVTRTQAARIEQRLRELGGEPSGAKGFFNSLLSRVGEIMQAGHDDYDRTTQNLVKAYATEHLEQGMYSSLIAYAEACGDEKTAMLAEEIMAEEEEAALKIFPMIEVASQRTFDAATGRMTG
jgi:ferritin-like metal-binding protein YciE